MEHAEFVKAVQSQAERLGVTPDTLAAELYYASAEALAAALMDAADSPDEGEYLAPVYVAAHGRKMDNFGRVCYRPEAVKFGKISYSEGGTRHVFTIPQQVLPDYLEPGEYR